jgi:hypothetical protein
LWAIARVGGSILLSGAVEVELNHAMPPEAGQPNVQAQFGRETRKQNPRGIAGRWWFPAFEMHIVEEPGRRQGHLQLDTSVAPRPGGGAGTRPRARS